MYLRVMGKPACNWICVILGIVSAVFCQNIAPTHRSVFAELGGVCGYTSLNYQHEIWHTENNQTACFLRTGIGTRHVVDFRKRLNPDLFIPALSGLRIGNRHALEVACGVVWANLVVSGTQAGTASRGTNTSIVGSAAYRWQMPGGRLQCRIAWTPYLQTGGVLRNWAGISTGYAF